LTGSHARVTVAALMRAYIAVLSLALVAGCGSVPAEVDEDADGYSADVDCDDDDATVHPGAAELCDDVDRNCDGDPTAGAVDGARWYADVDGDGFGDPGTPLWACTPPAQAVKDGTDCHDDNADAFPRSTATEKPGDGIDTDCDGLDACTDLNCDGLPDLVVPSHHDGDYSVTQPATILSGPRGWALEQTALTMNGTLGVAAADLNHDGYMDVVHASFNDGQTTNTDSFVYWGSATGRAASDRTAMASHGAHWPCVGDLNGDGWDEIVLADHIDGDYDTESYVYWNDHGTFSAEHRTVLPTIGSTYCSIAKLDGDDYPEIVFSNYFNGATRNISSYVYWGAATGYSPSRRTDLPTVGTYAHTVADVDSDGDRDLIFWCHHNDVSHFNEGTYIYWNNGGASGSAFSVAARTPLQGMGGWHGAVVDLNGDGHNEVIVPGYHNDSVPGGWDNMAYTYVYWGNATNNYSAADRTTLSLKGVLNVVPDDIDEDGHIDLLLSSHHDGDSYTASAIFWGGPGGRVSDANRTELFGFQTAWGAAIADLDHDGHKDVFLPGYHNNGWGNLSYSRVYWGGALGPRPNYFDEWATRGAWSALIVGR